MIILDNAPYNISEPTDTTTVPKMRKEEVLEELSKRRIAYHSNISVTEAKSQLREWQKVNIHPEFIQLAREEGHDVCLHHLTSLTCSLLSCSGRTSSQK